MKLLLDLELKSIGHFIKIDVIKYQRRRLGLIKLR